MLSNTLNTNEVKNSAGTEQEFTHLIQEGRARVFALINEPPALEHRLSVKHAETGSGLNRRRRSVIRFDKTVISTVDSVTPITTSVYMVADIPVGGLLAMTEPANVIANLLSFCASNGGSTTILYDGTGTGASLLLSGGL
jgi:hypothetical protein